MFKLQERILSGGFSLPLPGPPGVFSMSKWLISHNFVFSVLQRGAGLRDRLCSEYSKAGFSTSAWLFRLKKNWSEAICDSHITGKTKKRRGRTVRLSRNISAVTEETLALNSQKMVVTATLIILGTPDSLVKILLTDFCSLVCLHSLENNV